MTEHPADGHASAIADQFTRQAEIFARSPALHNEAVLSLLVDAAAPTASELSLDVACGPGSVVAAFAPRVRRAHGLDATEAMLDEARALAARHSLDNVEWHRGDVYRLPFPDGSVDIVTCRFAFHHLERPEAAFAEMVRVCRPGGRVVLCDAVASDDPARAAAFNRMERQRDPSTVAFRPLGALRRYFEIEGLPAPRERFFQVPTERDALITAAFPLDGDRAALRRMIDDAVDSDLMGLNAYRDGHTVRFAYPAVILTSRRPG